MGWLAELFETNRIIVLSIYGQVFFVMGLAIAFQSRHRSTLPLARTLPWLAGFGIVHGLMNWGYLFVPIQAGFLPQPAVEALLLLQLAMKPIGFVLLFQFGVELLLSTHERPEILPRLLGQPWLRLVPAAAVGLWAVGSVAISTTVAADFVADARPWLPSQEIGPAIADLGAILAVGDVLARGLLALPAGLVVAIGLRRTVEHLGPMADRGIARAMTAASLAFVAYAFLAGLVPMEAPFPPASVLNDSIVLETLGIPIEVFRSAAGLAMAVAVILSLELFERETDRTLAEARRRELLLRERERIARDLHDGIIQSIYAAGLHLEQAATEVAGPSKRRLATVMGELNRITSDIRGTIFDLGTGHRTSNDAEAIVLAVADELQAHTLVELAVETDGGRRPRLGREQAEQLQLLVTEAFSNILRHARARRVSVRLAADEEVFAIEILDDGAGFDPAASPRRTGRERAQGIENMHERAHALGAELHIESAAGQGTRLSLTMPMPAETPP